MRASCLALVSLSLSTLALAAPIPHDKRQIGVSVIATSSIAQSAVDALMSTASFAVAAAGEGPSATTTAAEGEPTASPTEESSSSVSETSSAEGAEPTKEGEKEGAKKSESEGSPTKEAEAPAATKAAEEPAASSNIDLVVLNLALTLEKLETEFYTEALKKFSVSDLEGAGLSSTQSTIIIEEVTKICANEATHASALTDAIVALGGEPNNKCSFNFESALTDPLTFLGTARAVELVGVSAYLGAAHLITDPAVLEAAGSILTLEARHQTLLNVFNAAEAAAQPFDIPITPQAVLALAGGFLVGCQASDLGLTTNQPLSVTAKDGATSFTVGSELVFDSTVSTEGLFAHMFVGGAAVAVVQEASKASLPEGFSGPVHVYLCNSSTPLAANILVQNQVQIMAGPAAFFCDSTSSTLDTLFAIQKEGGGGNRYGNKGALGSANLGRLYKNKMEGKTEVVQIVQQISITQNVIINNNGDNNNDRKNENDDRKKNEGDNERKDERKPSEDSKSSSESNKSSSDRRRMSRARRGDIFQRGFGDVKVLGWH